MVNLYELTKGLFGDGLIGRLVPFLGTDAEKSGKLIDGGVATLVAGLINKADGEGGLGAILETIKPFLGGSFDFGKLIGPTNGVVETLTRGHEMNQSLFGDGLKGIEQAFSASTGVSDHMGAKALKVIIPSLIGAIGSKLASGAGLGDLGELLKAQIPHLAGLLPAGIKLPFDIGKLGLGAGFAGLAAAALNVDKPVFDATKRITVGTPEFELPKVEVPKVVIPEVAVAAVVAPVAAAVAASVPKVSVEVPKVAANVQAAASLPTVAKPSMLPLLLGLATLGVLAFLGFKSCNGASLSVDANVPAITAPQVSAPAINAPAINAPAINAPAVNIPEMPTGDVNIEVAEGLSLNAAPDGIEFKLVEFIKSDKPVDKTSWFTFDRLYFDTAKASLKPESKMQLENIASIMKAFPNVKLKVGGYTDNKGAAQMNMNLSTQRAKSTVAELGKLGVSADRLSPEGYGMAHPIAPNDTEVGRAKNRRIDVRVTAK